MSDMRRLLEAMDSMSRAETKPTGPKFPGYWKGTDSASDAKNKMVGGCEQESVIPELAKTAKKKSTEWELEEAYKQFKEGEYSRNVIPQPQSQPDYTLDKGYGTALPKLPDPVGDQSGGFKKVLPGEKFDPGPVIKPEKAIDLEPVKNPKIRNMSPSDVDKELKKSEPLTNVTPEPIKTEPAKTEPAPVVQPEISGTPGEHAGPSDTFIKDPETGEWIENPNKANDIAQSEMDAITQQMQKNGQVPNKNPLQVPKSLSNQNTDQAQDKSQPTLLPSPSNSNQSNSSDTSGSIFSNAPKSKQNVNPLRAKIDQAAAGDQTSNSPLKLPNPVLSSPTQTTPEPKSGSWQEIAKLNNITDPTKLRAGNQIKLPDDSLYTVRPNDTLSGIASRLRAGDPQHGEPKSSVEKSTPEVNRGRPTMPNERNQTPPAAAPANPVTPSNTTPPDAKDKAPSVYGSEKQKADQEILDRMKDLDKRRSEKSQSAPSRHPTRPSITVPQSSTSVPQSAPAKSEPNISSQAGQDAQWEKDKERMKGWLPDWVKGKSDNKPTAPASTSLNDTRRQADIAALQREISRTPAREKTRLGILNKELADRQQVATNETLSQKLAKDFELFLESDEPYPGYDQDVEKLKQRARLGPMKTVWDEKTQRYRVVPVKPQEKQIKEYGNTQNADTQATNADTQQTSRAVDPSNPDAMAQKVDIATAKSTMSGLKNILGPQLNTNAAASGIVNMNDGKPLSVPEREAISTLTPLVTKAAENPATAGALKSALSTAGMLAKQGK